MQMHTAESGRKKKKKNASSTGSCLPVFLLLRKYISLDEISRFDFRQLHFKKWKGDVVGPHL